MVRTVENMLDYLSRIRKVYAERINLSLEGEKFTPNEISILILLYNNKSITTAGELTFVLGVSKGLVSRSLSALREKGLVIAEEDETDRRSSRLKLTENAMPLICRIKNEIRKINSEVLSDISDKDIQNMEETIEKILGNFEKGRKEHEKK